MRPILRPGIHVLRRDSDQLQVGLDPRHAILLSDDAPTRSSLSLLSRSADLQEYDDRGTLDLLEHNGMLLDDGALMPLLRPEGGSEARRHAVAAQARSAGVGTALLDQRRRTRIEVHGFGGSLVRS